MVRFSFASGRSGRPFVPADSRNPGSLVFRHQHFTRDFHIVYSAYPLYWVAIAFTWELRVSTGYPMASRCQLSASARGSLRARRRIRVDVECSLEESDCVDRKSSAVFKLLC